MPLNILGSVVLEGPQVIPGWPYIKLYAPAVATVAALKWYFRGRSNTWERDLHGKVFLITGGTSGLGATVVEELAAKGAQVVLLVRSTEDYWLVDYIQDLRDRHSNLMIYAEECDLASLYSIRKFATKWLDNVPPRRLDGVICTAAEALPYGKPRENSIDGVEIQMAVNYLAHFHLLTLLSPALRVQPPDRDVRVILTTCLSQSVGELDVDDPLQLSKRYFSNRPWRPFGTSKLELGLFAREFQRRLLAIPRKDKAPVNVRINVVNPGVMRSPSTKRVVTFGSLIGLFLYLVFLPVLWIFLKSTSNGAQSIFHALMNPAFAEIDGGNFISDCEIYQPARKEFKDETLQKQLYDNTTKFIERLEKDSAIERRKLENLKKKPANPKVEEVTSSTPNVAFEKSPAEELFPKLDGLKGKLNNPTTQKKKSKRRK